MEIKDYLLKEAETHINKFCSSSKKTNSLNSFLLKEAERRIDTAKNILMQKDAMAFTAGTLETKNANNIVFYVPPKSSRIRKIEEDLENAFGAYFKQIQLESDGKKVKVAPPKQIIISEDETKEAGEPYSSLRFEVRFQRDIYPVVKQPQKMAKNAVNIINQVAPGLDKFIEFLRSENITPLPYYHRNISGQEQKNTETNNPYHKRKITQFIIDQQSKYGAKKTIQLPGGETIDTTAFYSEHNKRISNNEEISVTHQDRSFQMFDADSAFDIQYPTYLMRAIAGKVWFGYRLDEKILNQAIEQEKLKFLRSHNINSSGKKQYDVFYNNLKNKIINEFNKALQPIDQSRDLVDGTGKQLHTTSINQDWTFGNTPDKKAMRGFRLSGVSEKEIPQANGQTMIVPIPTKHTVCMDLNLRELQFLLFSLQKQNKALEQPAMYKSRRIRADNLSPDQFFIMGYSITVNANGFDTDTAYAKPGYSGPRMSIVPPIRATANGIDYDSDQGNMGRNMIVTFGGMNSEEGGSWQRDKTQYSKLEKLLQEYGEWAVATLKILQAPSAKPRTRINILDPGQAEAQPEDRVIGKNIGKLYEAWKNKTNYTPYETWAKIIGTTNNGRRTSAETFVEKILHDENGQLRNNQQFKEFLNKSNASQLNQRQRSTSSINVADISDNLLPLLQKYGYAVAKMMDFVFAIMIRSSASVRKQSMSPQAAKKLWEEKHQEVPANGQYPRTYDIRQFGANYSVGTGKAEYGKILIGIKYAVKAEGIESQPGVVQEIVRKYKGAYHLPSGKNRPDPFTGSLTKAPELGNLQTFQPDSKYLKIVDDLSFWIGYSGTGTGGRATTIASNIDNFYDALAALDQRYPQIFDDVGAIFDPISLNLKLLREKTKACLTKITDALNKQGIDIRTVLINKQTQETTLCSAGVGEGTTDVASREVERRENASQVQQPQQPQQPQTPQRSLINPIRPSRQLNIPEIPQSNLPTPNPNTQNPIDPTNETPQPMKMKVNKHNKRQLFKNVEPLTEKIRKSSLMDKLVKVSDKMDEAGKYVLSNKLDSIIRWLGKNNVS